MHMFSSHIMHGIMKLVWFLAAPIFVLTRLAQQRSDMQLLPAKMWTGYTGCPKAYFDNIPNVMPSDISVDI